MHSLCSENSQKISSSPPVKFIHITEGKSTSGQATFEGSISDYLAKYRSTVEVFKAAEEQGVLKSGMEIIGPAIDSTSVAMAYVAADRGYNLTLTVPETMSCDNRKILAALGANVILTSATEGQEGAIKKAEEIVSAEPRRCFMAWRLKHSDNNTIHTVAQEQKTSDRSAGIINISVSAERTSDTITGVSRYTQHIRGKRLPPLSL